MPLAEVRGQISLIKGVFDDRELENRRLLEELPAIDETVAAAAVGILTAVGEVVGTLPNLLTLFHFDYTITERDFDVKDPAPISSIAGRLADKKGKKFRVFIPGFYSYGNTKILDHLLNLSQQVARLKTQRESLVSLLPKPGEREHP